MDLTSKALPSRSIMFILPFFHITTVPGQVQIATTQWTFAEWTSKCMNGRPYWDTWTKSQQFYQLPRLSLLLHIPQTWQAHLDPNFTFHTPASCPRITNHWFCEILPHLVPADWNHAHIGLLPGNELSVSSCLLSRSWGLPNMSEHKYSLGALLVHQASCSKGQRWGPESNSWKHADVALMQLRWSALRFC